MVKTQCDRVEAMFIGVSAMTRLKSPMNMEFSASSSFATVTSDRFLTVTLLSPSSRSVTSSRSGMQTFKCLQIADLGKVLQFRDFMVGVQEIVAVLVVNFHIRHLSAVLDFTGLVGRLI